LTEPEPAPAAIDVAPPAVPAATADRCLNCGALLAGAYCSECGQRAQVRRLSMAALFHYVLHDLVDLDSRLWRTLTALLLHPGRLTNEFITGRRTFYFPPFRLYLVLSLVYFILPSFKHETTAINVGNDTNVVVADMHSKEGQEAIKQAMQELQQDLGNSKAKSGAAQGETASAASSTPAPTTPPAAGSSATSAPAAAPAAPAAPAPSSIETPKSEAKPDSKPALSESSPLIQGVDCRTLKTDLFGGQSGWLQPRLVQGCQHLQTVSEREFMRGLRANIPKMMFIFLPLVALVNLVLYVFRRRTYVEHLLFYVHFHAFAFLLLTLQAVITAILAWIGHLSVISGLISFATFVYLFVYLFKDMRAVYQQGRLMTSVKYLVVLVAYSICALLTFIGMSAYTAFTV
jgi:Protein of unknown function (DUF3667)